MGRPSMKSHGKKWPWTSLVSITFSLTVLDPLGAAVIVSMPIVRIAVNNKSFICQLQQIFCKGTK